MQIYICDIIQLNISKNIPKKKNCLMTGFD